MVISNKLKLLPKKAILLLIALASFIFLSQERSEDIKSLQLYVPFTFSKELDPRRIYTVGDQVLAEHVFAFHARESMNKGFDPVMSDISFSEQNNEVKIRLKSKILDSTGKEISLKEICENLKTSLTSTIHSPYKPLFQKIECLANENSLRIAFTKIPVNLRFLFTVPDLSIFRVDQIPHTNSSVHPSTGPYSLVELTGNGARLKLNPFYPKEFRANNIQDVSISGYKAFESKKVIEDLNPSIHDGVYFYGYALEPDDLKHIEAKGFKTEVFSQDWLLYLSTSDSVDKKFRTDLAVALNEIRSRVAQNFPFAQSAYSVSPVAGPFGLSEQEYLDLSKPTRQKVLQATSQAYTIYTLESWAKLPVFVFIIEELKSKFPGLKIQTLPNSEIHRLSEPSSEIVLSPLGISKTDPLTHLSYLHSTKPIFKSILSDKRLSEIASLTEFSQLVQNVKLVESEMVELESFFPIAHFPGVVAISKELSLDPNVRFSWGLQAWSFQTPSGN